MATWIVFAQSRRPGLTRRVLAWLHLGDAARMSEQPPRDNHTLKELERVADRERARALEIRRLRETGNFAESYLKPYPPLRNNEDQGEAS